MTNTNAPSLAKHKRFRTVAIIAAVLVLILFFLSWLNTENKKEADKKAAAAEQARIELKEKTQSFYLPPCDETGECEEVPTVDAGLGTRHRIRADAPYRLLSTLPNGKQKIYNMLAGWDTLTGGTPAGKVRLMNAKGAKEKVLVEIIRVQ